MQSDDGYVAPQNTQFNGVQTDYAQVWQSDFFRPADDGTAYGLAEENSTEGENDSLGLPNTGIVDERMLSGGEAKRIFHPEMGRRMPRKRARLDITPPDEVYPVPGLPNATSNLRLNPIRHEQWLQKIESQESGTTRNSMNDMGPIAATTNPPSNSMVARIKGTTPKSKAPEINRVSATSMRVKKWIFENQRDNAAYNQNTMLHIMDEVEEDVEKIAIFQEFKKADSRVLGEILKFKLVLSRWRNWLASAWKEKNMDVIDASLSIFISISPNDDLLDELKLRKVCELIVKKGSGLGKDLAQNLLTNAKTTTVNALTESTSAATHTEDMKSHNIPREGTISSERDTAGTAPTSLVPNGKPKIQSGSSKPKAKLANTVTNTSFFTNLQQQAAPAPTRRTNTSAASKPAVVAPASTPNTAPVVATKSSSSQNTTNRGVSGFASIYASLKQNKKPLEDNVASEAEAKLEDANIPLRKKKSVSWKPDKVLVEVRVFENVEPDYSDGMYVHTEEFSNLRDLDRHEGMDLRNSMKFHYVEEEEDGEMPWVVPTEISFGSIPEHDQKGIKRGGNKQPESGEAKIQQRREQEVLLVHYPMDSDIPPSPTEPTNSRERKVDTKEIPLPALLKQSQAAKLLLQDNSALLGKQTYPLAHVNNAGFMPGQGAPNMGQLLQLLQSVNAQNAQQNQFQ